MKVSRLILVVCAVAASSVAVAQQIDIPDWESSVKFRLVASQQPIRPGDAFEIALVVEIEKGYHLYGPKEQEPSRTEISVVGEHVAVGEPTFPPVVSRELAGLGTYDLYEGSIAIKVPLTLDDAASGEEHQLVATVNYQVCTDFACSAPTSDELSITLPGDAAGASVSQQHPEIFQR